MAGQRPVPALSYCDSSASRDVYDYTSFHSRPAIGRHSPGCVIAIEPWLSNTYIAQPALRVSGTDELVRACFINGIDEQSLSHANIFSEFVDDDIDDDDDDALTLLILTLTSTTTPLTDKDRAIVCAMVRPFDYCAIIGSEGSTQPSDYELKTDCGIPPGKLLAIADAYTKPKPKPIRQTSSHDPQMVESEALGRGGRSSPVQKLLHQNTAGTCIGPDSRLAHAKSEHNDEYAVAVAGVVERVKRGYLAGYVCPSSEWARSCLSHHPPALVGLDKARVAESRLQRRYFDGYQFYETQSVGMATLRNARAAFEFWKKSEIARSNKLVCLKVGIRVSFRSSNPCIPAF